MRGAAAKWLCSLARMASCVVVGTCSDEGAMMDEMELAEHLEELRAAYYIAQSWATSAREELEEARQLASGSSGAGASWRGRIRVYEARVDWARQLADQVHDEYQECMDQVRLSIGRDRAAYGTGGYFH